MESWEKFADTLQLTKDLENIYFEMRKVFQREGWTQKDIEKPPYYPQELMRLHSELPPLVREINQTIRDYGFNGIRNLFIVLTLHRNDENFFFFD